MSDEILQKIELQLGLLNRLMAKQLIENHESLADKASLLKNLGFDRHEIAKICDAKVGSVSVLISRKKRTKKKGTK